MSNELVNQLSKVFVRTLDLPMIRTPHEWYYDVNKKTLNWGGYTINKSTGVYPGVHVKTKKTCTYLGKDTIDCLNYLQSVTFCIDIKALAFVENDLLLVSVEYLKDSFGNEPLKAKIVSYASLRKQNDEAEFSQFSNPELLKLYHKVTNLILLFLDTLVLALAYQEQDLYFPVFIDSRGRVYYNSGQGLNPQGGKLARFLLTLKNS